MRNIHRPGIRPFINIYAGIVLYVMLCLVSSNAVSAQFSINERSYKKLAKVENLIAQKNYAEAESILAKLERSSKNRAYELSLVYQAWGYLSNETNHVDKAIGYFEKCLALQSSPQHMLQNLRLNLVQAYAGMEDFNQAIKYFEQWREQEKSPAADVLALGGSLYAHSKQYDAAVKYLRQAISSTETPRESWMRSLLAVYQQHGNYAAAVGLLEKLVAAHPQTKQYWIQLFTLNYQRDNLPAALAALELAYRNNMLDSVDELRNLAVLYIRTGNPLKAAGLIQDELRNNRLRQDAKTLRVLADAYLQAREIQRSAQVFLNLAQLGHDPDMYLQAAQLFASALQWDKVVAVANKAGQNKQRGPLALLKGMALIELKQMDKAKLAFADANKFAATQSKAQRWLEYLETQ